MVLNRIFQKLFLKVTRFSYALPLTAGLFTLFVFLGFVLMETSSYCSLLSGLSSPSWRQVICWTSSWQHMFWWCFLPHTGITECPSERSLLRTCTRGTFVGAGSECYILFQ